MTTKIPVELSSTPGISDSSNATAITIDSGENVGIGTTAIPHGGIGSAKLAIEGGDQNFTTGPHIQLSTAVDDYPIAQVLGFTHDNISINFDSYHDGTAWTSADAGSNFQIYKLNDSLAANFSAGTAAGSALTWSPGMVLSSTGSVTKPNNPAFSVTGTDMTNIGTSDYVTVTFGTEIYDKQSNFASNVFTAPISGRYLLMATVRLDNIDLNASYYRVVIFTSNRTYYGKLLQTANAYAGGADVAYDNYQAQFIADMDGNDTAYVALRQFNGTAQSDVLGSETYFAGELLG